MNRHPIHLEAPHTRSYPHRGMEPAAARVAIERAFDKKSKKRRRMSMLGPSLLAVWLLSAAYYLFMPPTYISKWTLIVPVANSGSTVSLETIGQSSTQPNQNFGSITLSPKVIYKEIADSEQVGREAARMLGLEPGRFGNPRVKLIDETSLMMFQMPGKTPEEAQKKAEALTLAFNRQLDSLRRDESEKRSNSIKDNLKTYHANVDAARERIVEFQRASGLRSANQFSELVTASELMRRKISENRTEIEKLENNQSALMGRLGLDASVAAVGLKLSANPSFARLATAYAEANSVIHENRMIYGPNHPAMATARFKSSGAMREIRELALSAGVDPRVDLQGLVLSINVSAQSELMRTIVSNESALNGRRHEVVALEVELTGLEEDISRLSSDAGQLEKLRKDVLVTEAVLTSAVARLDTSKSDVFSSYPIVQTLAPPSLPTERTQPQLLIAIAAGLFGTLFILFAWGVQWVRNIFSLKRLKSS